MESLRGKSVIFPALIHNADKPVQFRLSIRDNAVKLPDLKRGMITIVVEANRKMNILRLLFHSQSRNGSFNLNSFLPIPCASYQ